MAHIDHINEFHLAAEQLISIATKEDLADALRLMSLNLAHYAMKYGQLPLGEAEAMAASDEPTQEQLQLVVNGFEVLVGMLGSVVQGMEPKLPN